MQDNWDSVVYVYDRTQAQNRLLLPVAALKFPLGPQTAPREEETGSVTKTATPRQARMVMTAHIDLRGNRVVARSVFADAAHDSFNARSSQSRSHFTQCHLPSPALNTHLCMTAAEWVEARAVPAS